MVIGDVLKTLKVGRGRITGLGEEKTLLVSPPLYHSAAHSQHKDTTLTVDIVRAAPAASHHPSVCRFEGNVPVTLQTTTSTQ